VYLSYRKRVLYLKANHGYVPLCETSITPIIKIITLWIRGPIYQETVNVTERTLLYRGL
jgi:hypothetical protein